MDNAKALLKRLEKFRYPLLVLLLGVCLLLMPTGTKKQETQASGQNALEEVLRASQGVGRVRLIVSDSGVVVVCDGAENAAVRWNILQAIGSYTGFGSDRITVLKMTE